MSAAGERSEEVIGREKELIVLESFLAGDASRRTLVLAGGPGIGKTTFWEAGWRSARERGWRLLMARPSGAETQFGYSALVDLLDDVGADDLAELAAPQRHALEAAILRTEPAGTPPEPSAIAVGFLNALRAAAERAPVLVAIDDVQWLDPRSADVLSYAARRLEDEDVRFLLARRPSEASALERALERSGVEQLESGRSAWAQFGASSLCGSAWRCRGGCFVASSSRRRATRCSLWSSDARSSRRSCRRSARGFPSRTRSRS